MMNTIQPVQTIQPPINGKSKHSLRHRLVSDSGYAALGFGTVCGITGMRKVKFPYKMKVHKYSAYLAGITSFLHFGFIKGLDKIFTKNHNKGKKFK